MRYSIALVGLAALASTAPVQLDDPAADAATAHTDMSPLPPFHFVWVPGGQPQPKDKRNNNMATDIKYTKYPSYKPYESYVPYPSAVEEAAAKEDAANGKRDELHMAADGKYENYPNYTPYGAYGTYPSAADAEAAKMDVAKRHEMAMDIGCNEKREIDDDGAVNPCWKRGGEIAQNPTHSNGAYGTYNPYKKYTDYSSYKRTEGVEA